MRYLLTADWVVDHDLNVYDPGCIVIVDGEIDGFYNRIPDGVFDKKIHVNGCIYPPFVNAHCHLEFSLFRFSPLKFCSFFDWIKSVVEFVRSVDKGLIVSAVRAGISEMRSYGIAIVGDISTFGVSGEFIKDGIVYSEVIGNRVDISAIRKPISVHSIYSVSAGVIRKVFEDAVRNGYMVQMHVGEVMDEQYFIRGQPNGFEKELFPFVGRKRYDFNYFDSIVDYLRYTGALSRNLIAVHCTNLRDDEIKAIMDAGAAIVICPRSNVHLRAGFPHVELLLSYDRVAIGTDGLSSNVSLSLVSEARAIYYATGGSVGLRDLLRMMTVGGLKVLDVEYYRKIPVFTFCRCDVDDPFVPVIMDGVEFGVIDLRDKK